MVFGLTFEKLLLIGVLAAFLIGPEKLPLAAEKLRDAVRWARGFAGGAKDRLKEELGDDFDEVDWRKLDPRQYDPRRIIRDTLLEDIDQPAAPVVPPKRVPPPLTKEAAAAQRAAATQRPEGAASRPNWAAGADAAEPDSVGAGSAPGTPFDTEAT